MILRNLMTLYLAAAFLWSIPGVLGSALTTTVGPNEKLCFYADVDKEGEKIGVSLSVHLDYLLYLNILTIVLLCRKSCTSERPRLRPTCLISNYAHLWLSALFYRSKLVARLTSTLASWTPTGMLFSTASVKTKATSSSQPTLLENTRSASRTTCPLSLTNSSTLT